MRAERVWWQMRCGRPASEARPRVPQRLRGGSAYDGHMPAAAFQLFLFFTAAAIVIGLIAWWVIGPRRPLAAILPVLGSFLALYLVGHKSGLAVGPTIELFGFEVNLLFDLLCATWAPRSWPRPSAWSSPIAPPAAPGSEAAARPPESLTE